MNPESIPYKADQTPLDAANDNQAEVSVKLEAHEENEVIQVLKRTLSDRAWQLFGKLYEAQDRAEFEETVQLLNTLTREDQLNYANPEAKIEEETLAGRMMETTLPINSNGASRPLRIVRSMRGTYEFQAV